MQHRPSLQSLMLAVITLIICLTQTTSAQTTSFTYQGRLTDGGLAANGNYDLQFTLWDSLTGGAQIGSMQMLNTISVVNGVFTVTLDFGAGSFPGANRFLEISTRASGVGSFALLTPRQPVTAMPYAIRSLNASSADSATTATTATTAANATQLGGVAASQYVQTSDARLSDARPPTAGSASYIQNSTNAQSNTNFNISGNGTVGGTLSGNIVNAGTQFNLGGDRVLIVSRGNSFVGSGAGINNSTGDSNSFFGLRAGVSNTTGNFNSYFGQDAGGGNGSENAFFGLSSGLFNSTGSRNTFLGAFAGETNSIGNLNTIVGYRADVSANNLTNATAIGANAQVSQNNSLILGSIKNVNSATADTNVGIGTTTPQAKLHVAGNVRIDGDITLFSLGAATSTQAALCRNTSSQIAFCNSSSLRYKKDISTFLGGMNIINRLRPIAFTWKADGIRDIGFGAEEVERIAPVFTFRNDKGQIEGVRYDRLGVLFVNAFKEQQQQISKQQQEIEQLQAEIRALHASLHRRSKRPLSH